MRAVWESTDSRDSETKSEVCLQVQDHFQICRMKADGEYKCPAGKWILRVSLEAIKFLVPTGFPEGNRHGGEGEYRMGEYCQVGILCLQEEQQLSYAIGSFTEGSEH